MNGFSFALRYDHFTKFLGLTTSRQPRMGKQFAALCLVGFMIHFSKDLFHEH